MLFAKASLSIINFNTNTINIYIQTKENGSYHWFCRFSFCLLLLLLLLLSLLLLAKPQLECTFGFTTYKHISSSEILEKYLNRCLIQPNKNKKLYIKKFSKYFFIINIFLISVRLFEHSISKWIKF